MAFSQRARAYTLNPTLPCPTLPLSPRALSDSSIIPAAGRLCLKSSLLILETVPFSTPILSYFWVHSFLQTVSGEG